MACGQEVPHPWFRRYRIPGTKLLTQSHSRGTLSVARPVPSDLAIPTPPTFLGSVCSLLSSALQPGLGLLPSVLPFPIVLIPQIKTPLECPHWPLPLAQPVFPFSPLGLGELKCCQYLSLTLEAVKQG